MPRGDNLRNNTDRTNALAVRKNILSKKNRQWLLTVTGGQVCGNGLEVIWCNHLL